MPGYKQKITLYYPLDTILMGIHNSAAEAGWRLVSQDRTKIVIREPFATNAITVPVQVEYHILPLSDSIGVEVSGAQAGFGTGRVQQQVEHMIALLRKHVTQIGTPAEQEARRREAEQRAAEKREAERRAQQELEAERHAAEQRAAELRFQRQLESAQREAERRAAAQQPPIHAAPSPAPAPAAVPAAPPAGGSSLSDELEKLARLHQQGLLTDDEFRQAKQRLLGL